jgi:hypothetical protein
VVDFETGFLKPPIEKLNCCPAPKSSNKKALFTVILLVVTTHVNVPSKPINSKSQLELQNYYN